MHGMIYRVRQKSIPWVFLEFFSTIAYKCKAKFYQYIYSLYAHMTVLLAICVLHVSALEWCHLLILGFSVLNNFSINTNSWKSHAGTGCHTAVWISLQTTYCLQIYPRRTLWITTSGEMLEVYHRLGPTKIAELKVMPEYDRQTCKIVFKAIEVICCSHAMFTVP